jgi:hypothetical protein
MAKAVLPRTKTRFRFQSLKSTLVFWETPETALQSLSPQRFQR